MLKITAYIDNRPVEIYSVMYMTKDGKKGAVPAKCIQSISIKEVKDV